LKWENGRGWIPITFSFFFFFFFFKYLFIFLLINKKKKKKKKEKDGKARKKTCEKKWVKERKKERKKNELVYHLECGVKNRNICRIPGFLKSNRRPDYRFLSGNHGFSFPFFVFFSNFGKEGIRDQIWKAQEILRLSRMLIVDDVTLMLQQKGDLCLRMEGMGRKVN